MIECNFKHHKLTRQELEICYTLSQIFNTCTSYEEILGDIKYKALCAENSYLNGREKCFALFRVKQKYKQAVKEVLAIKNDFSQKDLERLFYITASYCLQNKILIDEFSWALEEGWDKDEFIKGIAKMKEVTFLHKKYINFRVGNYYKILCLAFGFTRYSFEEQKDLLRKHSSIHFLRWNLGIAIMCIMALFVIVSFLLLASLDFVVNGRIAGFIIAFIVFIVWFIWVFLDKRQTRNP